MCKWLYKPQVLFLAWHFGWKDTNVEAKTKSMSHDRKFNHWSHRWKILQKEVQIIW